MSLDQISSHLVQDWGPALPPAAHMSFLPWLDHVVKRVTDAGRPYLAVRRHFAERQWNTAVSWMMGVAGTRQVLESEKYTWIAPLSAFYPETVAPTDLSGWHDGFPPSRLTARGRVGSRVRDRPDYVAMRMNLRSNVCEFAIVEAKGTLESLATRHDCPAGWREQANNAQLFVDDEAVDVARRMVVATRYNPKAVQADTRRLVIRAWNNQVREPDGHPLERGLDVVTAAVFGFCYNVGLTATSQALREAGRIRSGRESKQLSRLFDYNQQAQQELEERLLPSRKGSGRMIKLVLNDERYVEIVLSDAFLNLIDSLRQVDNVDAIYRCLRDVESRAEAMEELNQISAIVGEPTASRVGIKVQLRVRD